MKSKMQLLHDMINEITTSGDIVIDFKNNTGQNIFLEVQKNHKANYSIKLSNANTLKIDASSDSRVVGLNDNDHFQLQFNLDYLS